MAKRLIVVDSSLAVQKLMEFSLSKEGLEVTSFSDGLSALDAVEKIQPSLVVADYNLEGISVYRFCEKLRKQPAFHDRPILLMINYAEPIDRDKLKQAGVTDFIKKPVEASDLVEKIKTFSQGAEDSVEPTAAMFRPEVAQSSTEKEEMMKIEELLGWSIPPEQAPQEEPGQEKTVFAAMEEKTVFEAPREEIILVEEDMEPTPPPDTSELLEPLAIIPLSEQNLVQEPVMPAEPRSDMPPAAEVSTPSEQASKEIIEQVAWETVPGLAESTVQKLTQELLNTIVDKLAKDVIEKVAWEVIPALAEMAIKKEIEKLKSEE